MLVAVVRQNSFFNLWAADHVIALGEPFGVKYSTLFRTCHRVYYSVYVVYLMT